MPTTASKSAEIITIAYKQLAGYRNGPAITLDKIWRAPIMTQHDLTLDELKAGAAHLAATADRVYYLPMLDELTIDTESTIWSPER